MQITPELEAELLQVLEIYWSSYLNGDIDTWASYLAPGYHNIGTTEEEFWTSSQQIIDYTYRIREQLNGSAELRNRKCEFHALDPYIMVNEFGDMHLLTNGEWMYYGSLRMSSLLEKTPQGWKVHHQHGSYPDSMAAQGDSLGFEKVRMENNELREAVQRKTMDLEIRNRELAIEAALEKVRTVALSMQAPEDMLLICKVIAQQLDHLGIRDIRNVQTAIFQPQRGTYMNYEFYARHDKTFVTDVDYRNHPIQLSFAEKMMKGPNEEVREHLQGQALTEWFNFQRTTNQFADEYLLTAHSLNYYWYSLGPVALGTSSYSPLTEENISLFKRFITVFGLAYQRYLDIEKAMQQAREAQIEAALERVRARAMAMHSSEDLREVVGELRRQMGVLGQKNLETCVIHLHDESPEFIFSYAAIRPPGVEGEILETTTIVPKKGYIIIEEALDAYTRNLGDYVIVNEGEKLMQWFAFLEKESPDGFNKLVGSVDGQVDALRAYWSLSDFAGGSLVMVTMQPPDDATRALLRRFANVFGLAYRRYADLKHAEAQAREAQVEAALERVRARTMSMQRSDELAETAAVMFRQLIALGISPNRLYIILFSEEGEEMEAWVTDEDGSRVSTGFTGILGKSRTLDKMHQGWMQHKKTLVLDMQGDELHEYLHYLHDELRVPFKGGMEQKRRVQHIAYFSKGLIGMASPEPQPEETLSLLERFAAVFNLTFTRFNDLKIAEAHALKAEQDLIAIKEAKQKAEAALTELQATQRQLIQSEKMASLGELTAGIAHEIQNPLNFVNNFSEVSRELIDEISEALTHGDMDEAKAIMEDLMQNLRKINEHGKRADSIVKGMLQHSRAGSGQKELTDINAMADECLRLSFHGLRAKDKSFNANFETVFDPAVGKVEVMPQDIGRVLLNLINNAFYAVNERSKRGEEEYKPWVSVATARSADAIVIRVEDNGNGIPPAIINKIFQPFFTTKPTGQGTGLGLSLSYDIIKAHGGDLTVESVEGKGTCFMVRLLM